MCCLYFVRFLGEEKKKKRKKEEEVFCFQLLQKMTSPAYARYLRDAIDPTRTFDPDHYTNISGAPWREEGTSHISVIGPDGDAVSATSTINY